jgi:hypothetical protein
MTDHETLYDKLKIYAVIILFFCIVYPIKYVVYPFIRIIYKNIYLFALMFILWLFLYVNGGIENIKILLANRMKENPGPGKVYVQLNRARNPYHSG